MNSNNLKFHISEKVINLGVTGIYLAVNGVKNRDKDNQFEAYKNEVFASFAYKESVLKELTKEYSVEGFIESDSILTGFRELHTRVGRSNRKYISSPEFLVRRFLRTQKLPRINLLVDIYNMISLKTRLALGAHDIKKIDGNVSLRLTRGNERYIPLGSKSTKPILPGEYCYIDDSNDVLCRMEVLQVEKTKVDVTSKDCFFIIQGNKNTSAEYLISAATELVNLTKKYCGGEAKILYFPT